MNDNSECCEKTLLETIAGDPIAETKYFRKSLDQALQELRAATNPAPGMRAESCPTRNSRERSIAITKVQEAIMWLGMDLKAINEESPGAAPNPYPESYNPASPKIEPTSEGLKL